MRWIELERFIPYLSHGPERNLPVYPELEISVSQPGKYAAETGGGDFRVAYRGIAPKHSDKFELAQKFILAGATPRNLWIDLRKVMDGASPCDLPYRERPELEVRMSNAAKISWRQTLAVFQVIGLAEDRRYRTAARGGGRYLPLNFTRLILGQLITPTEAAEVEKSGLQGLSQLERRVAARLPDHQRRRYTSDGFNYELWGKA